MSFSSTGSGSAPRLTDRVDDGPKSPQCGSPSASPTALTANHAARRNPSRSQSQLVTSPPDGRTKSAQAQSQLAACGSKTIRRRVRVAWAKRSRALVDGRTFPPSMRAM
jgi:hypothetical protein